PAGVAAGRGGAQGPRGRRRRQHRVAMGAAHRRLRAGDRRGREAVVIAESRGATDAAGVRARGVTTAWALCSFAFLLCALLVGLGVGAVGIGPGSIIESVLSNVPLLHVHSSLDSVENAILWQLRAPRVVVAALVGGMLAIAGASYQGVFRNPLADPYLLGVAAGAGLGATLVIAYGSASAELVPVAAFAGASVGATASYVLGRAAGPARMTGALVLAGVTVTSFL